MASPQLGGGLLTAALEGLPEFERAMEELEQTLAGDELAAANLAGAEVIAEEWRIRVPVLDGNYRSAIAAKVFPGDDGSAATVLVERVAGVPDDEQPMAYAARLEYGDAHRTPHPSARPAADAARERAIEAIRDDVRARLPK